MADTKRQLDQKFKKNNHELHIMTAGEFLEVIHNLGAKITLDNAKTAAGYVATVDDLNTLRKQIKELGMTGRAVLKTVNGKQYVILKGYPGLRNVLKGTRYLANNPKITSIAIGKIGAGKAVLGGAKITIALTVPINVLKFLLDEQATLGSLIGNITSDLVKLGISSALGAAAAAAVGTVTTIAAGPLVAAIVIGLAAGLVLEKIDADYGLTDELVKLIDETFDTIYDRTIGELKRGLQKMENILNWQARNGIPLGKGIFY